MRPARPMRRSPLWNMDLGWRHVRPRRRRTAPIPVQGSARNNDLAVIAVAKNSSNQFIGDITGYANYRLEQLLVREFLEEREPEYRGGHDHRLPAASTAGRSSSVQRPYSTMAAMSAGAVSSRKRFHRRCKRRHLGSSTSGPARRR